MGKLLCEKNLRDVWCRNEIVRAEIGQIVHTHTHTHTRVSYSSIDADDDLVIMSPSAKGLQRLVDILCAAYGDIHGIKFNHAKTVCMS